MGRKAPKFAESNFAEPKCLLALKLLMKDGRISGYKQSKDLDDAGIDFMIYKFVRVSFSVVRVVWHLQVKQHPNGSWRHKNRYPQIPILIVPRAEEDMPKIAEQIWRRFCKAFRKTTLHERVKEQRFTTT